MQLDFAARELTVKLVYYGPALSGKTSNLRAIHRASEPDCVGRLMTLDTRDDRTLFFDLLPLTFRSAADVSVRLKVFTVPGQVLHASTRRLVVQGADGVAFVADSRASQVDANAESFLDLKHNLKAHGMELGELPLVIQFNKRDLPEVRSDAELAGLAERGCEPVYLAVATQGVGVVESFLGLLHLTLSALDAKHDLKARLGLDSELLLRDVAARLGAKRPLAELLGSRLGGALDVLRTEELDG